MGLRWFRCFVAPGELGEVEYRKVKESEQC